MVKLFLSFLPLYLVFISPAHSDDYGKGVVAYKGGDYAGAMRLWKPLAERGDARVQFIIGNLYYKGQGTNQSDKLAFKWFKRAAEQGNVRAQNNLGTMYMRGLGTRQNYTRAFIWLNIAASKKDETVAKNLKVMVREMEPGELEKAKSLSLECVEKEFKGC